MGMKRNLIHLSFGLVGRSLVGGLVRFVVVLRLGALRRALLPLVDPSLIICCLVDCECVGKGQDVAEFCLWM